MTDHDGGTGHPAGPSVVHAGLDCATNLYQAEKSRLFEGVMAVHDVPSPAPLWTSAASAFERWRSGDEEALEELVRLLSPVLWQVARAAGLDRGTAEDVVQTTWLALVDHADSVHSPQAVTSWLTTSARREAWRVAKQSGRQRPVEDGVLAERLPAQPGPEPQVLLDDDAARLWTALTRLPERCQRLLRIVAAEPKPDYAAVAETLQMPVGSIGPTRGRCLAKLRVELASAGGV